MEVHPILEMAAPTTDEPMQDEESVDEEISGDAVAADSADTVIKDPLTYLTEQFIAATGERAGQLDWHLAEQIIDRSDGIPTDVGQAIKNAATSAAF
jgi:hypothetical protein